MSAGFVRQLNDGATANAVDIAVDKGLRVAAKHGNQHLIEGNATRLVGGCHATGCIARFDANFACAGGSLCGSVACLTLAAGFGCGSFLIAVIAQVAAGGGNWCRGRAFNDGRAWHANLWLNRCNLGCDGRRWRRAAR